MSQQWDNPPEMQIDPAKSYGVSIETDKGTIEIDLFASHAPNTVTTSSSLHAKAFTTV